MEGGLRELFEVMYIWIPNMLSLGLFGVFWRFENDRNGFINIQFIKNKPFNSVGRECFPSPKRVQAGVNFCGQSIAAPAAILTYEHRKCHFPRLSRKRPPRIRPNKKPSPGCDRDCV